MAMLDFLRKNPLWIINIFFAILFFWSISKIGVIFSGFPRHDYSGHLALAVFLQRYGFHGWVPNWYNGFILFLDYPPGLAYYLQPFLSAVSDPKVAMLIALASLIVLTSTVALLMARHMNLPPHRAVFLFLMINASFPVIANIYWGRMAEIAGWIIALFGILIMVKYLGKKTDFIFLGIIALVTFLLVVTYTKILPLFGFVILGYMLKKPLKESLIVLAASAAGVFLSLPWLAPLLLNFNNLNMHPWNKTLETYLMAPSTIFSNPFAFMYVLGLMSISAVAIIRFRECNKNLFFAPVLIPATLGLTMIVAVLPLFKLVDPHSIAYFLIIILTLAFIKEKAISKLFLVFIFLNMIFSAVAVGVPANTMPGDAPFIELLPYVSERFIVLEHNWSFYFEPIYAYGAVYYNLNSSFGMKTELQSEDSMRIMTGWGPLLDSRDCSAIVGNLQKLKSTEVIAYSQTCNTLKECNFTEIKKIDNFCLLRVGNE